MFSPTTIIDLTSTVSTNQRLRHLVSCFIFRRNLVETSDTEENVTSSTRTARKVTVKVSLNPVIDSIYRHRYRLRLMSEIHRI